MRNPGSRELRRRQARLEGQQRAAVREQTAVPNRSEMMRRGGLLEGLSPKAVTQLTLVVALAALILILAGVVGLFVETGQHDLFLGIVVLVVALVMTGLAGSVVAPAMRAARRDRKVAARNIQGQLVGASPASPTPGLATVAVNVGHAVEQFRVRRDLFDRIHGGATVVGLTVTPTLNYVQTLTVIRRDQLATMTTPPVTRAIWISVWLPLASLAAVVVALGIGCLIGSLLPIADDSVHPVVAALIAIVLAGAVTLGGRWYGQKLARELGVAP
ncbi:MAG: hypothetical protein ACREN7_03665 [Candidatus Dormibacteria bacterium]